MTRERLLDRLEAIADLKEDIERRHAALVDEALALRAAMDKLAAIIPGCLTNKDNEK